MLFLQNIKLWQNFYLEKAGLARNKGLFVVKVWYFVFKEEQFCKKGQLDNISYSLPFVLYETFVGTTLNT